MNLFKLSIYGTWTLINVPGVSNGRLVLIDPRELPESIIAKSTIGDTLAAEVWDYLILGPEGTLTDDNLDIIIDDLELSYMSRITYDLTPKGIKQTSRASLGGEISVDNVRHLIREEDDQLN